MSTNLTLDTILNIFILSLLVNKQYKFDSTTALSEFLLKDIKHYNNVKSYTKMNELIDIQLESTQPNLIFNNLFDF